MRVEILAATIFVLAMASAQKPAPMMAGWKFYDSFGDATSLAYYGGYVMVHCVAMGRECDETVEMELVLSDGTAVADGKCDLSRTGAWVRLNIDDKVQFGEYQCRYKDEQAMSSQTFKMSYRLCGDGNQACLDTTGCESGGGQMCIVSSDTNNPRPCSKVDKNWCEQHPKQEEDIYADDLQARSLCAALSEGKRPLARMNHRPRTQKDIPELIFSGNDLPYNGPVRVIAQNATFRINPSEFDPSKTTCVVKNRAGNETTYDIKDQRVHLDAVLNGSSQILKLLCTLTDANNANNKAWLSAIIVVLEGRAVTTATLDSAGQYTKSLHCSVEPAPSEDIQVSFTWFRKPAIKIKSQESIDIDESGEYYCEATLTYKTCSPFAVINSPLPKSESIHANADPHDNTQTTETASSARQTTPKTKRPFWSTPENNTTPQPRGDYWLYIGIALGVVLAIVIVVIVIVVAMKMSGKGQRTSREMSPPKELLMLATDRHAFNLVQLRTWATERILKGASDKEDDEIKNFEKRAAVHEVDLDSKGLLCVPEGSRYENVFTRKDTIVRLAACNNKELPFNVLEDFHRNRILLGQAPTAKGSGEHWKMMYQEKVGVIVWVGDVKSKDGDEKIFPYASMQEGQPAKVEKFRITATSVLKARNGCDTYILDVNPEGYDRRQMTLVHITQWPDHNAPQKPVDMAKAVIHIADQQAKRASQGLPTLLFHCSAGVQRSVATVVCYIGRQMWLAKGTVHPMGILDYVRRHRYQALAMTADAVNTQLALIGGVLEVICMRASEQMAGKMATDSMRDVSVFHRKESAKTGALKSVVLA